MDGVDSKKSPTGPTEWTPKPEYLIAKAPYLGVRGKVPFNFWWIDLWKACFIFVCFIGIDDD